MKPRALNLTTLETRRLTGDLIEVFEIIKGIDILEAQKLFKLRNTLAREHSLKLVKHWHHLNCQKFSFSLRAVDTWKCLSEALTACDTVDSFKSTLDKFLKGRGFI